MSIFIWKRQPSDSKLVTGITTVSLWATVKQPCKVIFPIWMINRLDRSEKPKLWKKKPNVNKGYRSKQSSEGKYVNIRCLKNQLSVGKFLWKQFQKIHEHIYL